MKKIAIFGAGGFGREVATMIQQINFVDKKWTFIGFFDDGINKETPVGNSKVLGGISEVNKIDHDLSLVFAIGDPKIKRKLVSEINSKKIFYPTLVHPNVFIGDRVSLGEGCIICGGNIITTDITIGNHVILNLSCTVGHDAIIGNFCSFMPSVNISGEDEIGIGVLCGTGVKIINQIRIGDNTIIGAGAVVLSNLPANCTAVGVPARPIKFHE